MDYPIRPVTADEAPGFFHSNAISFGHDPRPPEGLASTLKYADLGRSISVWDETQVVGTAGTWTFDMSTPGGSVPCGGLTWVSVLPSHRRKGILTAMMRYQLDQERDREYAVTGMPNSLLSFAAYEFSPPAPVLQAFKRTGRRSPAFQLGKFLISAAN